MPEFEVIKDIRSLLGLGPIVPSVYALSIEHLIETFRRTIVATTAYSAHATGDVVRRQDLLVLVGDELTCDPNAELPSSGWAAPYRHQHLLHDQVAVLPATHRLAYGHSRIQTQHNVEIEPVLSRTDVRDVSDPSGVGRGRGQVPFQMLLCPGRGETGNRPPPLQHTTRPSSAHQARHSERFPA